MRWTRSQRLLPTLEKLEAERQAALTISEQKAEEAKLIQTRLEGFRAAVELLTGATSANSRELQCDKSGRRRPRRDIPHLILHEMSFCGQPAATAQIAQAIGYIPERTETALKRLETDGKVTRNENGRWIIAITAMSDEMTPSEVDKTSGKGSHVLNSAKHSSGRQGPTSVASY
jgi:hypothetical protein